MTPRLTNSARALVAGAICLAVLGGMLVGHAWPLWTGQVVVLAARPVDPRDLFRGEFVRLDTPATVLAIAKSGAKGDGSDVVTTIGEWPSDDIAGRVVYVQLGPSVAPLVSGGVPEHRAVSISLDPVPGAINLRGRVHWSHLEEQGRIRVGYGLDAFYMQEGTAPPVEEAMRAGRPVQMEVAIASSGRARIRTLIVDGRPLTR